MSKKKYTFRTVQKVKNSSTFFVTLPIAYAREHKLQKGDQIVWVPLEDGTLRLVPLTTFDLKTVIEKKR